MRSLKITTLINTPNSHFERFSMHKWRLFINDDRDKIKKMNESSSISLYIQKMDIFVNYIDYGSIFCVNLLNKSIWSAKSNEVRSVIESLKMIYNLLALLCSIPIDWLHFQVTFTRIWSTQYLSMFPYKILVKRKKDLFGKPRNCSRYQKSTAFAVI